MNNNLQGLANSGDGIDGDQLGRQALWLCNSLVLPMVLRSAVELGLFDIIYGDGNGEFFSPSEIVSRPRNPEAPILLDRVLRLLASHSIVKCRGIQNGPNLERKYAAEPICRFFISASVGSLMSLGDMVNVQSWYHLNDTIMEGGVPFERATGMSFFDYIEREPRFSKVFNEAMSCHTAFVMSKALESLQRLPRFNRPGDVGGGTGRAASVIKNMYPAIKTICFDLPHVVSPAHSYPGVERVGGDMFKGVPKGEAIFMKWILHNWDGDHCLKILRNCWDALPKHGKVIMVDSVLEAVPGSDTCSKIVADFDVTMMTVSREGKERTLKELNDLAVKSGFRGFQLTCYSYGFGIMEFYKREILEG